MASIFELNRELEEIFEEIESLDGEITPEIEQKLKIHEGEVENKLRQYFFLIRRYENDINLCKDERNRLSLLNKTRENRIERIKKMCLMALDMFGRQGKSGNRTLDYYDFKMYTANSTSYKVEGNRANLLLTGLLSQVEEMTNVGIPFGGDDYDLGAMLAVVNANLKAQFEARNEDFLPFTISDLLTLKINIAYKGSIADLILQKELLQSAMNKSGVELVVDMSASDAKDSIKISDIREELNTICRKDEKVGLRIK